MVLTSCLGPSAEENRGEEGVVCTGETHQNKPVISKPGLSFLLWGLGRTVQVSLAGYMSEGVGVKIPATLHRLSQLRTLRLKRNCSVYQSNFEFRGQGFIGFIT